MVATTFASIEILKTNDKIDSIVPGVIVAGLSSLLVVHCFISIYEVGISRVYIHSHIHVQFMAAYLKIGHSFRNKAIIHIE